MRCYKEEGTLFTQTVMLALLHLGGALAAPVEHAPNPVSTWLRGIDVSHYQGRVDWSAVASANISFACAKATDGNTYVDATFGANWKGMHAAGIVRCAYHFARPQHDAVTQARHFVTTVNAAGGYRSSNTLQLMLDLESNGGLHVRSQQDFAPQSLRLRH